MALSFDTAAFDVLSASLVALVVFRGSSWTYSKRGVASKADVYSAVNTIGSPFLITSHAQWRSKFSHLAMRPGRKIAKVAMARKLAVHLYWMWREGWDYEQWKKFGSHAGAPENRRGVP
jgi:hypothetical protein